VISWFKSLLSNAACAATAWESAYSIRQENERIEREAAVVGRAIGSATLSTAAAAAAAAAAAEGASSDDAHGHTMTAAAVAAAAAAAIPAAAGSPAASSEPAPHTVGRCTSSRIQLLTHSLKPPGDPTLEPIK
jgi:hypothetical protein